MNQENANLVSVIIPVYNGERYLQQAIDSVINQTYISVEIIIINDGSTDNSENIVKNLKTNRKIHYFYQNNKGVSEARNQGLYKAKGKYIAFLDQDDLWIPNKIDLQVSFLEKNFDVDFVIGKQKIFIENGTPCPSWLNPDYLKKIEGIPAYLLGALLARKSAFQKIGNFECSYRYGSDHDWFLKAIDAQLKQHILDDVILLKRIHDSNESHNIHGMKKDVLKYLRQSISRKRQAKIET